MHVTRQTTAHMNNGRAQMQSAQLATSVADVVIQYIYIYIYTYIYTYTIYIYLYILYIYIFFLYIGGVYI